MRELLILVILVICPLKGFAGTSMIRIDGELVLEFTSDSNGGSQLILQSDRPLLHRELVWKTKDHSPIVINRRLSKGAYTKTELVAGSVADNLIVAAFKQSPGEYGILPAHFLKPSFEGGMLPKIVSKYDLLIRSFIRAEGRWEPYLAFYPQTFCGDLIDERLMEIKIVDRDSYNLVYEGAWSIVDTKYLPDYIRPRKFRRLNGSTIRKFRYSQKKNLLFFEDSNNSLKYTDGSIWWNGIAPYRSGGKVDKVWENLNQQNMRLKNAGIEADRFRYYSEFSESDLEFYSDVFKHLEKENESAER